jgi:hypothetical protein
MTQVVTVTVSPTAAEGVSVSVDQAGPPGPAGSSSTSGADIAAQHATDLTIFAPISEPIGTAAMAAVATEATTRATNDSNLATAVVGEIAAQHTTDVTLFAPISEPVGTAAAAAVTAEAARAEGIEAGMAPIVSPTFTGTVAVPNTTLGDNSTKAANTAALLAALTNQHNTDITTFALYASTDLMSSLPAQGTDATTAILGNLAQGNYRLPVGSNFKVSQTIVLPAACPVIEGAGDRASNLKAAPGFYGNIVADSYFGIPGQCGQGSEARNLEISGLRNPVQTWGNAAGPFSGNSLTLLAMPPALTFANGVSGALVGSAAGVYGFAYVSDTLIQYQGVSGNTLTGCHTHSSGDDPSGAGAWTGTPGNTVVYAEVKALNSQGHGIAFQSSGVRVTNVLIGGNGGSGLFVQGPGAVATSSPASNPTGCLVNGLRSEGAGRFGIEMGAHTTDGFATGLNLLSFGDSNMGGFLVSEGDWGISDVHPVGGISSLWYPIVVAGGASQVSVKSITWDTAMGAVVCVDATGRWCAPQSTTDVLVTDIKRADSAANAMPPVGPVVVFKSIAGQSLQRGLLDQVSLTTAHTYAFQNGARTKICAPTRLDPSTTATSTTVNDPYICADNVGWAVAGAGIPAGSFVGAVTPGVSYTLVNSAGTAVATTATSASKGINTVTFAGSTVTITTPGAVTGIANGSLVYITGITGVSPTTAYPVSGVSAGTFTIQQTGASWTSGGTVTLSTPLTLTPTVPLSGTFNLFAQGLFDFDQFGTQVAGARPALVSGMNVGYTGVYTVDSSANGTQNFIAGQPGVLSLGGGDGVHLNDGVAIVCISQTQSFELPYTSSVVTGSGAGQIQLLTCPSWPANGGTPAMAMINGVSTAVLQIPNNSTIYQQVLQGCTGTAGTALIDGALLTQPSTSAGTVGVDTHSGFTVGTIAIPNLVGYVSGQPGDFLNVPSTSYTIPISLITPDNGVTDHYALIMAALASYNHVTLPAGLAPGGIGVSQPIVLGANQSLRFADYLNQYDGQPQGTYLCPLATGWNPSIPTTPVNLQSLYGLPGMVNATAVLAGNAAAITGLGVTNYCGSAGTMIANEAVVVAGGATPASTGCGVVNSCVSGSIHFEATSHANCATVTGGSLGYTTSSPSFVTDTLATYALLGKAVTGAGFPTGCYVYAVVPGVGFHVGHLVSGIPTLRTASAAATGVTFSFSGESYALHIGSAGVGGGGAAFNWLNCYASGGKASNSNNTNAIQSGGAFATETADGILVGGRMGRGIRLWNGGDTRVSNMHLTGGPNLLTAPTHFTNTVFDGYGDWLNNNVFTTPGTTQGTTTILCPAAVPSMVGQYVTGTGIAPTAPASAAVITSVVAGVSITVAGVVSSSAAETLTIFPRAMTTQSDTSGVNSTFTGCTFLQSTGVGSPDVFYISSTNTGVTVVGGGPTGNPNTWAALVSGTTAGLAATILMGLSFPSGQFVSTTSANLFPNGIPAEIRAIPGVADAPAVALTKTFAHPIGTFNVPGAVSAGTMGPVYLSLGFGTATGQTTTIIGAKAVCTAGTATVAVQRNGANVSGLSALAVSTTLDSTPTTTPPVCAESDAITLVISSPSGCSGLSVTVFAEDTL